MDADFMVVFDKPLLWRANLYIDEGAGIADWNNRNPWTDEDNNEWFVSADDGADVDGGQISIENFTFKTDASYENKVAYDYYNHDSPFDFNKKMLYQKEYLSRIYNSRGIYSVIDQTNLPMLDPEWDDTTAPADTYKNYIKISGTPDDAFNNEISLAQRNTIAGNDAASYPYKPGFTYYLNKDTAIEERDFVNMSSGVDCMSFVRRAMGYEGESYTLITEENDIRLETGIWYNETRAEIGWRTFNPDGYADYIWEITRYSDDPDAEIENLEKIIPGDLIFYDTHVMLLIRQINSLHNLNNHDILC